MTQDGTTVNVWVENKEYNATKVTPKIVQELLSTYAGKGGVYDIVTSIGGPVWRKTTYTGVIAATGQPIDLVVTNFNSDGPPYGLVGYFYSLNNFFNAGSDATARSNQDLSLYLDSETLYLAGDAGLQAMKTTMAHESEHLPAFYRRSMSLGQAYTYDSWVQEMAMMMADWTSFNLDVTYNSVRDGRFPEFLSYNGQGSYTCGLDNWQPAAGTCDSYSTNGTFGGFLNRQVGLAFYKAVLTDSSSTDTKTAFSNVINKFSSGTTLAQLMRHFAIALDGSADSGGIEDDHVRFPGASGRWLLAASDIDPANFRRYLPSSASPPTFQGLSSFPAVRTNMSNSYQESVTLPPNTSLTVVVQ